MDPISTAVAGTMTKSAVEPMARAARRTLGRRLDRDLDVARALESHLSDAHLTLSKVSLVSALPAGLSAADVAAVIAGPEFQGAAKQLVAVHLLRESNLRLVVGRSVTQIFLRCLRPRTTDTRSRQLDSLADSSPLVLRTDLVNYVESRVFPRCDDLAKLVAKRFAASLETPRDAMDWAYASAARLLAQAATPYADNLLSLAHEDVGPEAVERWLEDYRRSYTSIHARIDLPDLSRRRSVGIDDLFVLPAFSTSNADDAAWDELGLQRAVLLGDPGAGKSTASSYISLRDWAQGHVPFFIVLRHVRPTSGGFSVLSELRAQMHSRYQVDAPVSILKQLLGDGRAVVYFDGLDELPSGRDRFETSESIETFCRQYPLSKIFVTSRIVGYQENALQSDLFDTATLLAFDLPRVERYVRNWFMHAEELSESELDSLTSHFLEQSMSIQDLRSNPLLLAYICILYRGKEFIPKNRADLFRMCAELLLKEWDLRRRIIDDLLDLKLAHRALSAVAHHILQQRGNHVGVPEAELLAMSAAYLVSEEGVTEALAGAASLEIVRQCQDRGWIFTNVGTGARFEERWDFTHQSFREYYGARYLHRHGGDAKDLAPVLVTNLLSGRWEVLTQLVLLFREEGMAGQATELFAELVASTQADGRDSLLTFVAKTAELISLPSHAVRELTGQCLAATAEHRSRALAMLLRKDTRHEDHVRVAIPDLLEQWATAIVASEGQQAVDRIWFLTHLAAAGELGLDAQLLRESTTRFPSGLGAAIRRYSEDWTKGSAGRRTTAAAKFDPAVATHLALCHGAGLQERTDRRLTAVSVLFERLHHNAAVGPFSNADWLVGSMSAREAVYGCRGSAVRVLRELGGLTRSGEVQAQNPFPLITESRLRAVDGDAGIDPLLARAAGYGEDVLAGLMTVLLSRSALHGRLERQLGASLRQLTSSGLLSKRGAEALQAIDANDWWLPDSTGVS